LTQTICNPYNNPARSTLSSPERLRTFTYEITYNKLSLTKERDDGSCSQRCKTLREALLPLIIITQTHQAGGITILSLQAMKVKLKDVNQLALHHAPVVYTGLKPCLI
jgi:hypothetical protein